MQLGSRFSDALVYAAGLHAQQRRKLGGAPYVAHLLAVTSIVLQYGDEEDEAIAALLHDAVEDQGGAATAADIRQRFGDRVARIVLACSDATATPKPPWRARKEAHVAVMRGADFSARLVTAADKCDNLRSLVEGYRRWGEAMWERFTGGRDGTLWYYHAMLDALRQGGHPRLDPLLEDLDRMLAELEELVDG